MPHGDLRTPLGSLETRGARRDNSTPGHQAERACGSYRRLIFSVEQDGRDDTSEA